MMIDRVENLTKETFLNEYLLKNKPVVVTDAMTKWNMSRFQPESLKKNFGVIPTQIYNDLFDLQNLGTLGDYLDKNFNNPDGDCKEYIRWYTKLKNVDFLWSDDVFSQLEDSWNQPYFLPDNSMLIPFKQGNEKINVTKESFPYKGLFISGKGARTRLHRDPFNSNAILCQLYGKKQIFLFSPEQTPYVMNEHGFVNVKSPDLSKFPDYNKAKPNYKLVLNPEEIILFPAGWFHDVTSITDSISVTWNFIHKSEVKGFYSFVQQYPCDDQLEIAKYFLGNRLSTDDDSKDIITFLNSEFAIEDKPISTIEKYKNETGQLVANYKMKEDYIKNQAENEYDIINVLFDESFKPYDTKVVKNLRKLVEYYLVDEKANINDVISQIEWLANRSNDIFDRVHRERERLNNFDKEYGTQTEAAIEQFELEDEVDVYRWVNCARYLPSPVHSIQSVLNRLPKLGVDYKDYIFIDVGSGMGRNLLIASEYPFEKIVGVEISKHLHNIAEKNIEVYNSRTQKCHNLTSLCIDILNFEPPNSKGLIYYFWEPFSEALFNKFYFNLLIYLKNNPKKVYLIFLGKPYHAAKASNIFQIIDNYLTEDKISETEYILVSVYSN